MTKALDALVLCGGLGSRLKKISGSVPKPLVKINGEPVLDKILSQLSLQDRVNTISLLAKYKYQEFQCYYKNRSFNEKMVRVLIQQNLAGTGGALLESIRDEQTETLLLLNGDTLIDFNFLNEINEHDLSMGNLLICSYLDDVSDCGCIKYDDNFRLVSFSGPDASNRKKGGYAYTGISLLNKQFLELLKINKTDISFENDIVMENLSEFKVKVISSPFLDIGTPERFSLAESGSAANL